jgi:hypothetical protein
VLPADTGPEIPRPRTEAFSVRIFLSPKNDHTPVGYIQPRRVGMFIPGSPRSFVNTYEVVIFRGFAPSRFQMAF